MLVVVLNIAQLCRLLYAVVLHKAVGIAVGNSEHKHACVTAVLGIVPDVTEQVF